MRNVLLASLVALSAVVANSGCVPFGCGGFEGAGNRAYEQDSKMVLLCTNGGFVATLDDSMIEGRYTGDTTDITATRGADGQFAFQILDNSDGTALIEDLSEGMWTSVALDTVAADHANVLCNDLTARSWWNGGSRIDTSRVKTHTER